MTVEYLSARRTNGANPFSIFESLGTQNQSYLYAAIRKLPYDKFLESAYWFGVSSVAKSRAGMRCQVCNSSTKISAHHRTYDNHGKEHLHMNDIVVLCENCHGLFHGHSTVVPVLKPRVKRSIRLVERPEEPDALPALDDPVILTKQLIGLCRANGSFTNSTLRAFGFRKDTLTRGWPKKLEGIAISRETFLEAYRGRTEYNSGPLPDCASKVQKFGQTP